MASAKHRNGIRFAELLMRQEAVVRRHMPWESLDFEDARVVEIGCGPLGGYGPLAIFRGAASFESAEPEWDAKLFLSDKIATHYLYILHADLVALYGERMDFESCRQALAERITIHKSGFEKAPISQEADILLSQSCLEHGCPLDATIDKLASIQRPDTRFLHLVDFGNHYLTANPFDGLYEQTPADYIAKRGKAINMLRVNDVASLFKSRGLPARIIPTRIVEETYTGTIHPWWSERYNDDALFTQLVLLAGPTM